MSKTITFAQVFPAYHPKAGQPTGFLNKILAGLNRKDQIENLTTYFQPKYHTIRKGERWKVGDKFSPRVWTDLPYKSKHIEICEDLTITRIYPFIVTKGSYILNGKTLTLSELKEVAANDGLQVDDFELWFESPFIGQLICWTDKVKYPAYYQPLEEDPELKHLGAKL